MKFKHYLLIGACSIAVVFSMSFLVAEAANVTKSATSSASSISFPIAELGNCGSIDECKVYCDDLSNVNACLDYALKNDLMPKEQVEIIKKETKVDGPGGCTNRNQCETYCDKEENFEECVSFAEKNNIISTEEAKVAKKLGPKIDGPGGCKGKRQCDAYCGKPENFEVCVKFAEENGLMDKKEAELVKKIGPNPEGPGGCKGKKECDNYCGNPVNQEECVAFAEKYGLLSKEEAKNLKKFVPNAEGPGGCKGPDECKTFCDNPDNQEACLAFAEKYELMSKEELAMARKMGPLKEGPGGCKGKTECDAFCGQEANQEICINFSVEHGLVSKEEAEMMKQGPSIKGGPGGCQGKEECDNFCQKPENMETCVNFSVENGFMSKDEADRIKQGAQPITPNGNCKEKDENCPAMDASGPKINANGCQGEDCEDFGLQDQSQPKGMIQKFKNGIGVMKKFISPDDPNIVPNCKGDECKIKLEQVEDEGIGEEGQAFNPDQPTASAGQKSQGMIQKFKNGIGVMKKFVSPDDPDFVPNCKGDECKIKLEPLDGENVEGDGQGVFQPQEIKQGSQQKPMMQAKPFNKIPSGDPALAPNCQGEDCKIKIEPLSQPKLSNQQPMPKIEIGEIKTNE